MVDGFDGEMRWNGMMSTCCMHHVMTFLTWVSHGTCSVGSRLIYFWGVGPGL